jgi:UrcA family protein
MKTRFLQSVQPVLFGLVITAIPAVTSAADSITLSGQNAITVKFSDLDLSKVEGARALYQRIRTAARNVCGQTAGRQEVLEVRMARNSCVKTAIADAVKSIDNEQLNALYYRDNGSAQKS